VRHSAMASWRRHQLLPSMAAAWLVALAEGRGAARGADEASCVATGAALVAAGVPPPTSSEELEATGLLQHGALRAATPPALGATEAAAAIAATSSSEEEEEGSSSSPTTTGGPRRKNLTVPLVHGIYTFGAPATRLHALTNAATEDGCFPGLRNYNENLAGFGMIHQIDAGAMWNTYDHAKINSAKLHWQSESYYYPCGDVEGHQEDGHPAWPAHGVNSDGVIVQEWRVHHEYTYRDRLWFLTINGTRRTFEEPFKSALLFINVAYRVYERLDLIEDGVHRLMPGWKVLHHDVWRRRFIDTDPILLVQEQATQDCAMAFSGTNSLADFPASIDSLPSHYCGFDHVHVGYVMKLRNVIRHLWENMRPKLQKCRKLFCAGHSMGGSLCELFSACANSRNTSDPDYQALAWIPLGEQSATMTAQN